MGRRPNTKCGYINVFKKQMTSAFSILYACVTGLLSPNKTQNTCSRYVTTSTTCVNNYAPSIARHNVLTPPDSDKSGLDAAADIQAGTVKLCERTNCVQCADAQTATAVVQAACAFTSARSENGLWSSAATCCSSPCAQMWLGTVCHSMELTLCYMFCPTQPSVNNDGFMSVLQYQNHVFTCSVRRRQQYSRCRPMA